MGVFGPIWAARGSRGGRRGLPALSLVGLRAGGVGEREFEWGVSGLVLGIDFCAYFANLAGDDYWLYLATIWLLSDLPMMVSSCARPPWVLRGAWD